MTVNALPVLESVISTLCERNHIRSEDEFFPPPLISADDVLADLFTSDSPKKPNRRAPGTWSLETLMEFLARRDSTGDFRAPVAADFAARRGFIPARARDRWFVVEKPTRP